MSPERSAESGLLPLSDWRSTAPHTADQCELELCPSCGCCCHGRPRVAGCPMDDAPYGSHCGSAFSHGCACEGRSGRTTWVTSPGATS